MDRNCTNEVKANCRSSSTEEGICFKVRSTGAILKGSVTTTFNCAMGGVATGKTFTSDGGVTFNAEDAYEVACPMMVMAIPVAGVEQTGAGGGSSAALTDSQLRASPLNVTVSNPTPAGLTDTQLRAAPLTVTVANPTETGLTDTQLRAAPIAVTSAQLPVSLGAKNTAGSLSTTLASDSAPMALRPLAQASANYSVAKVMSVAGTNATLVKAGVVSLYGWSLFNTSASMRYFKLYNGGTVPVVGSSAVMLTISIPPGSGTNISFTHGVGFSAGMSFAIAASSADNDASAVAAADVIGALFYA